MAELINRSGFVWNPETGRWESPAGKSPFGIVDSNDPTVKSVENITPSNQEANHDVVEVVYDDEQPQRRTLTVGVVAISVAGVAVVASRISSSSVETGNQVAGETTATQAQEMVAVDLLQDFDLSEANKKHANPNGLEFVGERILNVGENQNLIAVLIEEVDGIDNPGSIDSLISFYRTNPDFYTVVEGQVADGEEEPEDLLTQVFVTDKTTGLAAAPVQIIPLPAE